MSAKYMPKTLAKTISYIACHAPGEYGLFWDQNGTMPWKEFYWALQEDPSLRFVREAHMRELVFLGLETPVVLEGNVLRLQSDVPIPEYPLVDDPPERLYHACRRKQYLVVLQYGISASSRPFVPLASEKELALRMGRRRDTDPILIEVQARKASARRILFRGAGPDLYLVESVPVEYLLFPPVREEELLRLTANKKKEKASSRPEVPGAPGSFLMDVHHFQEASPDKAAAGKGGKKGERGPQWKRSARKERHKRNV